MPRERPQAASDQSPPWILFIHEGRPSRILPAGRMGDGIDVSSLTMARAKKIVSLGNELHYELMQLKMTRLGGLEILRELLAEFRQLATHSPGTSDE